MCLGVGGSRRTRRLSGWSKEPRGKGRERKSEKGKVGEAGRAGACVAFSGLWSPWQKGEEETA